MKVKFFAGFLGCFLLLAANARAEHKLLVTEVLDAGQYEAQATFEYENADIDFTELSHHEDGELRLNAQVTRLSLAAGLGHEFEVSASIPYMIYEKETVELGHDRHSEELDGLGDLTLGAKYRLLEDEHSHLAVAAGIDVKLDSASDGEGSIGSGTTDVSPYLAASKEVAEHVEGYAVYRAELVNHGGSDEHSLTLGVEAEFGEALTLDAALKAAHHTAGEGSSSFDNYGVELAGYVQVAHGLYLIPFVGAERSTSLELEEGAEVFDIDPATRYFAGMSVYVLF